MNTLQRGPGVSPGRPRRDLSGEASASQGKNPRKPSSLDPLDSGGVWCRTARDMMAREGGHSVSLSSWGRGLDANAQPEKHLPPCPVPALWGTWGVQPARTGPGAARALSVSPSCQPETQGSMTTWKYQGEKQIPTKKQTRIDQRNTQK